MHNAEGHGVHCDADDCGIVKHMAQGLLRIFVLECVLVAAGLHAVSIRTRARLSFVT